MKSVKDLTFACCILFEEGGMIVVCKQLTIELFILFGFLVHDVPFVFKFAIPLQTDELNAGEIKNKIVSIEIR